MQINAYGIHYKTLNDAIRETSDSEITIRQCCGQRYIGAGARERRLTVYGTPGNALGAYLNGGSITVYGNAQDATGDTMNSGEIIIHGSCGDCAGYGMRSGRLLIRDNAGYRVGIHMKTYRDFIPVIVIGENAGDFLGEYQAGGKIIVLGLNTRSNGQSAVGHFCGTGLHGGAVYIRVQKLPYDLPPQVLAEEPTEADLDEIRPHIEAYHAAFYENIRESVDEILRAPFIKLTPDSQNPYRQLYCNN